MIFVSYSWRDTQFVRPFVQNLHSAGVDTWIDYQHLDLSQDIQSQLQRAISGCRIMVLFGSRHALSSWWVQYEQKIALNLEKRRMIVPVSEVVLIRQPAHLTAAILALHSRS